jgi:ribosomal protein L40E
LNPETPRYPLICRECGAENDPGASECWLCQRRDWRPDGASVPVKAAEPSGGPLSRRPIAIAIVAGTVVILGLGMVLDIWNRSDFWGVGLLIATLVIPLGLILWARARRRPPGGPSMSNRDVAAAGSTIAAAVILLTWLYQAADPWTFSTVAAILAILAVPAGLITLRRARRRSREGRPMTALQVAASMVFLTVLLPPLLAMSLVIALWLVCVASRG